MRSDGDPCLRVENLVVEFPAKQKQVVHAVSGISFDVLDGETVGVVGESGCGKSTTGRAVLQLPRPTSGSVVLDGIDLTSLSDEEMRRTRPKVQMIFQDPISSLNPRRRVRDIVREGAKIWGLEHATAERVDELLDAVGLDPRTVGGRLPHELSGGQSQRVCIARALLLEPRIIVCDEPVSALDVSVQAQILNLLEATKARYQLSMLFISHDLAVVKHVSDRIIVMYLGKMCEVADASALFVSPRHPYTQLLLASIPKAGAKRDRSSVQSGRELPSPMNPPSGCRFRTRCPHAQARCAEEEPELREIETGQYVACHFAEMIPAAPAQ